MSVTHCSLELRRHLLQLEVGLVLAMDHIEKAEQSIRTDHVCDGPTCQLCRLVQTLKCIGRATMHAFDEVDAEGLVDVDELDAGFVRVQEVLSGPTPEYLAGLHQAAQRVGAN